MGILHHTSWVANLRIVTVSYSVYGIRWNLDVKMEWINACRGRLIQVCSGF